MASKVSSFPWARRSDLSGRVTSHWNAGEGQVPREPGPVTTGALDAHSRHVTETLHPGDQREVAVTGGGEIFNAEHRSLSVQDRRDVLVLVGIDPSSDFEVG
jgi:hypothetical protein